MIKIGKTDTSFHSCRRHDFAAYDEQFKSFIYRYGCFTDDCTDSQIQQIVIASVSQGSLLNLVDEASDSQGSSIYLYLWSAIICGDQLYELEL